MAIQGPAIGNISVSLSANQSVNVNQWGGTSTTLGQKAMSASVPVAIASDQSNLNVVVASALPVGANVIGAVTQSGTWNIGTVTAVTAITNALPAGSNVIGHVIADSGSTTAVTGNVTVVQSTASSLNATVVGTGTFATQATLQSGDNTAGRVKITDGTTVAGVIVGTTALKTDLSSIAGTATNAAAAGTQLVGIADGTGNALTSNSTTYTAKKALDANLLGTLGTAFSTAGKVDIKAADGDVFVRSNAASTFPVNATQVTSPWIVAGGGTAGSAATGVVTIQGIASMTKLLVTPDANSAINLAQVGGTNTVTGGVAGSQSVGGTVATNVAITANPLNLGAQAVSSENSAVTTARQVQLVADLVGKLIVLPYANPENFVSGRATATDTTSTSVISAPASGLRNYITQITVWNSSATSTYIKIQDGSGGTELYDIPAPAGGGATLSFPTPLRQPTTATAIYFAAAGSANAVFVSVSGYKGA